MSAVSVSKKFALTFVIALFLSLPAPAAVLAAAMPEGFTEWPLQTTEDTEYKWSVKFNLPVDESSIDSGSIYVTDNCNQLVNTSLTLTAPDTVEVAPAAPYEAGREYRLFVEGDVTSGNGSIPLKKPVVVPFVVAESDAYILSVTSIYTDSGSGITNTKITVCTRPDVYEVKVRNKANGNIVTLAPGKNDTHTFNDFLGVYGMKPGVEIEVRAYNSGGGLLETVKHTIT